MSVQDDNAETDPGANSPRGLVASVDLKDTYFHIQIALHHRCFLRFAFEGTAYQYSVLPFGLALAPHMDAALYPLRASGMRILNWTIGPSKHCGFLRLHQSSEAVAQPRSLQPGNSPGLSDVMCHGDDGRIASRLGSSVRGHANSYLSKLHLCLPSLWLSI